MNKIIALSVVALMAASAAPAFAQSQFDGAYVGGVGGYGFSDLEIEGGSGSLKSSGDGFVGGAFGGYGQTFDDFYVGIEAGVDFSEIQTDLDVMGVTMDLNRKAVVAASARAGYLFSDDMMVYASAGITNAYYEGSVSSSSGSFAEEGWQRGYRLGAGIEKSISSDLFVRAGFDFDIIDEDDVKLTTGVAKAGFGLRF